MKLNLRKKAPGNFLDMIPMQNVKESSREGDRITLHVPKFKSEWMLKWIIPGKRSTHFRVHLDATGSKIWELIDGVRDTREICRILAEDSADAGKENLDMRVTEFLRQLYKNRFILFRSL